MKENQAEIDESLLRTYLNYINPPTYRQTYIGGGFVTVLGHRRKVVMKGRTKYVNIKGEMVALSKAKAMEKTTKK